MSEELKKISMMAVQYGEHYDTLWELDHVETWLEGLDLDITEVGFIRHATPAVILELINRIEELEDAYRKLENGTDGVVMRRALRAEAQVDELTRLLNASPESVFPRYLAEKNRNRELEAQLEKVRQISADEVAGKIVSSVAVERLQQALQEKGDERFNF